MRVDNQLIMVPYFYYESIVSQIGHHSSFCSYCCHHGQLHIFHRAERNKSLTMSPPSYHRSIDRDNSTWDVAALLNVISETAIINTFKVWTLI